MIRQIGRHRIKCGDVTKGIDDLMGSDRAMIMYSDPPWGDGNIKYWATMNKKATGQVVEPALLAVFLDSVFGIAERYVDRWLLIEYGVRWCDEITRRGELAGFEELAIAPLVYSSENLPLHLHIFGRPGAALPAGLVPAVSGTKGYLTVQRAIGPLAAIGATILDPCCGMGYTAQAAVDYGMNFRGNELNQARLDKTIARLERDRG